MLVHDQQRGHGQRPLILFTSFSHVARTKLTAADEAKARRKYADNAAAVQRVAQRHGYPHWSPLPVLGGLSRKPRRSRGRRTFSTSAAITAPKAASAACRADPSLKRCRRPMRRSAGNGGAVTPRARGRGRAELEARAGGEGRGVGRRVRLAANHLAIAAACASAPTTSRRPSPPPRSRCRRGGGCLRWRNNGTFAAPSARRALPRRIAARRRLGQRDARAL